MKRALYQVENKEELALQLEIPVQIITRILYQRDSNFAFHIESYYKRFEIPKRNGDRREICAPEGELKAVQKKIASVIIQDHNLFLREMGISPNISHGFEKGKSIITNARIHKKRRYLVNLDLENFFESIHFGRVKGFFMNNKEFCMGEEAATVLANLCCYHGSLPQGAPTSPIIANLIANILDMQIVSVAKKYHLQYTRYADDLSFSTNDKKFFKQYDSFLSEVTEVIAREGFCVNDKKTRLQYKDSRQEVTGVVVNEKLNVPREYYKKTRAMAQNLYRTGKFTINGVDGTINELEGRFAYINQFDKYNNGIDRSSSKRKQNEKKLYAACLNAREREYQKFLFYKYFYANNKNLVVTEGKTDVMYLKAALKKYYTQYPKLVEKKEENFIFHISFLERTKRLRYFMGIALDGADTLDNIYQFYVDGGHLPNLYKEFNAYNPDACTNKILLLFDNEQKKEKPLKKFMNHKKIPDKDLLGEHAVCLIGNLYLMTNPLVKDLEMCEIEDLFDDDTLKCEIKGRQFDRNVAAGDEKHFGKNEFAEYVLNNYQDINMEGFIPLLDMINEVV